MKKDCVLCSCLLFRDFRSSVYNKTGRLPMRIIMELYSVRNETLFERKITEAVAS